ncbi:hypothetical protein NEOLEDRAFT_1183683 [Neolentinus lepideus HHB14362 ss-1]|uniref:DUF6532 domain-containing protein n=1 Tax=Neolentinus lepideus HHB14362 ss-1 TaxID=1314782 RepID=A0A165N343_9AGAM|nr:hypothetical protein NEOLEDRAFT_1183683 [Neolentinus lepideus HHB14362 ss-1]
MAGRMRGNDQGSQPAHQAPGPSQLTKAQKAAATRARNRQQQDAQDALALSQPKVPCHAKVQAVENRVWLKQKDTVQVRQLKRAALTMAATEWNASKKSKKDTPVITAVRHPAATINDNSDEPSEEELGDESDEEAHAECEADVLESDDERLMSMGAGQLAAALSNEAPLFYGTNEQEEDYGALLHGPVKVRRKVKARSSSASSYDSANVSIPDDVPSEDEGPVSHAASRRSSMESMHSHLSFEDTVISHHDNGTAAKTIYRTNGNVPTAVDLFQTDDHVTDVWTPAATVSHRSIPSSSRFTAADIPIKNGPGPYDMTALVYNNKNKVNLTVQTPEIREVLHLAIDQVYVYILTKNAYLEVGTRHMVALDACTMAAEHLGTQYMPILNRLQDGNEKGFRKALADIVDGRISVLRRDIKRIAINQVLRFYALSSGKADYVKTLMDAQRYMFPGDHTHGQFNNREPWCHGAIVAVMRMAYFTGSGSFRDQHHDLFLCSDGELWVPDAMVALIHVAIDEWSSGDYKPADFTGNSWARTYEVHISTLNHVRTVAAPRYYQTMNYLFQTVRAANGSGAVVTSQQPSTVSLMDLQNEV